MAGKNKVSMQNLADELGISKVTVSKALNGKDGVSEELKKKIFEIAEQRGYVLPDYGNRKTRKIGIIMSQRFNSGDEGKFYMDMFECIVAGLRKHLYSTAMLTPDRKTLMGDLKMMSQQGTFDGLIFLGILDSEVKKQFDALPLPKVYVDIYDETHKSDSVVTENIYSTYEITNYLIEKGHRDIGFVGTVGSTTSITDRYLGYVRRLLEQGISPKENWIIPDRDENGMEIPLQLPKKLPTAFVCNCDKTAFDLVKVLKMKGIRVPEDISIVGFDNSIYARLCEPALTTIAVNINKIGKTAVKCVRKYMEQPDREGGEVFRVPGEIVCRDSVKEL